MSWNIAGLVLHRSRSTFARRKMDEVQVLARRAQVIALQEVHGYASDIITLEREFPRVVVDLCGECKDSHEGDKIMRRNKDPKDT